MKKNIYKNRVYVDRTNTHLFTTIIYFSSPFQFPLSDAAHKNLDRLQELTDLYLVFDTKLEKVICPRKLGSLYQAEAVCITSDKQVPAIIHSLAYCKEVIGGVLGYFFINALELPDLVESDFKAMENIRMGKISKSVFTLRRMDHEDLSEIYLNSSTSIISKWAYNVWRGMGMEKWFGRYSTHTSLDSILFLRPRLVTAVVELASTDSIDYIQTFNNTSFETFLCSYMVRFGKVDELLLNLPIDQAKS